VEKSLKEFIYLFILATIVF